jgi:hypothetical protein
MATQPSPRTQQPPGAPRIAADEPLFLEMPVPPPDRLDGIITDGLVLRCSGDRSGGLYGNSGGILGLMAGEFEVQEIDDPSWTTFPSIAAALRGIAPGWSDECFCICVCRGLGVWGVGIASRARNRQDAARIALAGAIAAQSIAFGNALPVAVRSYPAFVGFVGLVGAVLGTEPPRVGEA